MKVLVVNAGSSSLKYQLLDMETEEVLAKGNAERIGLEKSFLKHKANGLETLIEKDLPNHEVAINLILSTLCDAQIGVIHNIKEIDAIGHRVVSGGENYREACLVNGKVIEDLKGLVDFAPLHAVANAAGIEGCVKAAPEIPNVVVFDTAFLSTMPEKAFLYALPMSLYRDFKIRRYGAHGTSHKFVAQMLAEYIGKPFDKCKLITCHLGNGSSITAIDNGKCVDTSMGMTPLEGMIMGTRSGDVDANILNFVAKKKGWDLPRVTDMLNKESGLLGISEVSSDMRDLCENLGKDERADLAMDMLAYRVKKYIGAYAAAMDGVDVIVFTGGIGENTPELRERVISGLNYLGVKFDNDINYNNKRGENIEISTNDSKVRVLRLPTNEEVEIARDTKKLCK